MYGISLVLIIVKREDEAMYLNFLKQEKLSAVFTALCHGTASQSMLSMLGLEQTEKRILAVMMDKQKAKLVCRKMIMQMGINVPGNGIAVSVPVRSIGGASAMRYLMEGQDYIIEEAANMNNIPEFPYDLIVSISERGSGDTVMDAARSAGARGGTIVQANGMPTEFTNKFFGISLAEEKDILLIVANSKDKAAIMKAIMDKAGVRTPAHAALFSLPVEDVVGLTSVMQQDEAK